jgi:hypothetical protein
MDCEASGENGEVKINASERGETERDTEQIQSFHLQTSGANRSKSRASLAKGANDEARMTNDEGITKAACCRVRCPQRILLYVVKISRLVYPLGKADPATFVGH